MNMRDKLKKKTKKGNTKIAKSSIKNTSYKVCKGSIMDKLRKNKSNTIWVMFVGMVLIIYFGAYRSIFSILSIIVCGWE